VIQASVRRFDAADAWESVARHRVDVLAIVGDAFGRPLADEIEAHPRELPSLRVLITGGAALNAVHKERLLRAVPGLTIIESIGSSESGVQGRRRGVETSRSGAPIFRREEGTVVLSDDMSRTLPPGHEGTGWIATAGRVPLGYLGDPEKTARTFPTVDGRRLSVPGDRARLLADGTVEVLGRDSVTINTGGEKVFAEEVEAACKAHPAVADAVVCGRRSDRWGAEVVALVQARPATPLTARDLIAFCALHLARYKLPKGVVFVDEVRRSPAGKADYRWAVERANLAVAAPPPEGQ
jgi:acyl-CoA synthetase (AMP-forming)/AMP-acid ligase II